MDYVALRERLAQILRERDALDAEVQILNDLLMRKGALRDPDAALVQEELAAARALRDPI